MKINENHSVAILAQAILAQLAQAPLALALALAPRALSPPHLRIRAPCAVAMDAAAFKAMLDEQRTALRDDIKTAVDAIGEVFDGKLRSMHDKIMEEVARRIAEMQTACTAAASAAASTAASRSGSSIASEAGMPHAKRGRFEVTGGRGASGGNIANPNQVWFLGFPRELLRTSLERFVKGAIDSRMPNWVGKYTVKAFNLENKCSVLFEDAYGAHRLLDLCRGDDPLTFEQAAIRVRPDRSAQSRHRGRLFGKLWSLLEEKVNPAAAGLRIGSSPVKGKLFVINGNTDDVKVLFEATAHGGDEDVFTFDVDACKAIGLSEEDARDMIDRAKDSVARGPA